MKRAKKKSSKGDLVKSYAEFLRKETVEILVQSRKKHLRGMGIYALYDKNKNLVYLGKATSSLGRRIKGHGRSKKKNWAFFSYYELKNKKIVDQVESIILRIDKPIQNKQKGKLGFTRKKNKKKDFIKDAKIEKKRLKKSIERDKKRMSRKRKRIRVVERLLKKD